MRLSAIPSQYGLLDRGHRIFDSVMARQAPTDLVQPFHVAEVFTGSPGVFVDLQDTIKGFKGIVAGEYDDLPEQAFYMCGKIEESMEKARKMAAEAA